MRICKSSVSARFVAYLAAVLTCAMIPRAGHAQAPSPGVFSEIQAGLVPGLTPALEPATQRSRVVQVDTQQITAARLGRETLRLNLFDDVAVVVRIDRVRPTGSGYFISGRPLGMEWGEVRLVVNGPVIVGTIVTPEARFTIRFSASGRHVIRQIDPSAERSEHDVDENFMPTGPPQAGSSVDPLASTAGSATKMNEDVPTEDGSEIRVLVVYTPTMQAQQGGTAGMEALIDLMIHSANHAFEISGINPRLVLAHTALVDYAEERSNIAVVRLYRPDDGHMDEVHALRDKYAADLVHLLTIGTGGPSGTASPGFRESLTAESSGFAVTASGLEETFTHETGHNFGLEHDRYTETVEDAVYPYAFGYVNNRAFAPGAPVTARWRTVMAYLDRCSDAGFSCPRLMRFSNPDQTHGSDPLGVPPDDPATGPEGPADARLTINRAARWVASFRSEACTEFSVSPETPVASVDGGEVVVEVDTAPGCLWEASSQSGFLTPPPDARRSGPGFINIGVEANQTEEERIGKLTVAGNSINVRQLATDAGICGRSPLVVQAIAGHLQCDEVTDNDLTETLTLSLDGQGVGSLKAGDFEGLSNVTVLDVSRNQLTDLPEGLFAGLSSLETLRLSQNRLTDLPEGIFAGLSSLETLALSYNRLTDLSNGWLADLSSLERLELDSNGLTQLSQEQFADLANLEVLSLSYNQLSTLPDGVFAGLTRLMQLHLSGNRLDALPNRPFAGLSELEVLELSSTQISIFPEDAFADLSKLRVLNLQHNILGTLPGRLFAGLSDLERLYLWGSRLNNLPEDLFAGLSRLERLSIGRNRLTTLPDSIFSVLGALKELNLEHNQLSDLPDGIFSGLTSLESLYLGGNRVEPLPIGLTLERVGENQFKAVAPTGAPFALPIAVSSDGGTIEGSANSVTIRVGTVESAPLSIARIAGMQQRITVDIGSLPDVPDTHSGYVLEKDRALPLSVLPSIDPADASLSGLSLRDGTLDPVFSPEITRYTASVAHGVTSTTVTLETSNASATAAFHDEREAALPDTDANADGHQVSLNEGENVIKIEVSAENGTSIGTYTIVMTREATKCDRTAEVLAGIVKAVPNINECGFLRSAHLAEITELDLSNQGISSLKSGDFAGLSALERLLLNDNQLTILPADVFSDLAALVVLELTANQLESLPDKVFFGLSELRAIILSFNRLSRLPEGIFSGLSEIYTLWLGGNALTSLPPDAFSGLSALQSLTLHGNALTTLDPDTFSGLSSLRDLWLGANELTNLPAGVFSDLSALQSLWLYGNALTSLPADAFSGLFALRQLWLNGNQLTTLPDGVFAGLTRLRNVGLGDNAVDPMPLSVSLDKVGEDRFKAVVPTGAPFALDLPLSVSAGGEIEGGADAVTVPAGAVESVSLSVTRVAGESDSVTVDIGTLPSPPKDHWGYVLEKDATLPIEIALPDAPPSPAQVEHVEVTPDAEILGVSWTSVPEADGYKVQWKSGEEEYGEARQAVITDGDTERYAITGLAAGTEYTVRVIATRENADDGPASDEVAGTPRAASLAQVTRLGVKSRMNELRVSWTAVAEASGYKVQWRSGEDEYDEARQAVIDGGDAVTYTITGLSAGTEYTVRVIATGVQVEDGPPSEEVSAMPRSGDPDVNGDGVLDRNDAQIMIYAYVFSGLVGDGESGGTAEWRQRFLAGYSGRTDPSDEDLKAMLRNANDWRTAGVNEGGDINEDGMIDGADANAMYYAYAFGGLLGNGETGGTARFRSQLLGPLAGKPDPTDEDLREMLRRANKLREEYN